MTEELYKSAIRRAVSDFFVIGTQCADCGVDEGNFHKEGCAKIKEYDTAQEKVDSVEFLRKQAYYRPGQEGQEREWCKQMNAAADEIEILRSKIVRATAALK